jgi:hypothetical protein
MANGRGPRAASAVSSRTFRRRSAAFASEFSVGDFSFSYAGTGTGASMDGAFDLTATTLRFMPSSVVSDLIRRDGYE